MFLKIRLLLISISSSALLILVLCLGAQNLKNRKDINLAIIKSDPLPTGFIVGVSIALGVISGGSTKALMINNSDSEENEF
tara:strand:- start:1167 stop:1409 length:243 start_codon:yes stop_codon:yes gene_type:complete